MKTYRQEQLKEIVFPLGGIGAGSIGLAGNGKLVDCEIFNRPNRESTFGYTSFAVKAENDHEVLDYRVLTGDNYKDYIGTVYGKFGQGNVSPLCGFRHFQDVEFKGSFPIAQLTFADKHFPGHVQMEAFNPFIPSNENDSSLPAAFFTTKVTNPTDSPLTYSVALSVTNPFKNKGFHTLHVDDTLTKIQLNSAETDPAQLQYGNVTVATDTSHSVSYQQNWFRGQWRDMATMFMNDFSAFGPLKNRVYSNVDIWQEDTAVISAAAKVPPGEVAAFRFVISWYVPNGEVSWPNWDTMQDTVMPIHNHYATRFDDASAVADYCFSHWDTLWEQTRLFTDTLYASNLPECIVDAVQGNLAILKSSTCLRLEDGSFWAWEGVNQTTGSCQGTCQHVWNYAYTLPFLFPKLEKGVRSNEYKYNMNETGRMIFRTNPSFDGLGSEMPCVDGQMGSVMQAYRDWKISGDTQWLRTYWPQIKKALEYAWHPENPYLWDPDKSGLITGRQHHTLDMELYGVNSWLTGFYHGALLAASEMAKAVGEEDTAAEYLDIFQRGQAALDERTFNGEYFVQNIDITDPGCLVPYGQDVQDRYWSDENRQIKYQYLNGCEIDQVVADWHAELMGLPAIFIPEHKKSALQAIYRNNFMSMRELSNPWRVFAMNDEKGTVMCTWPKGQTKPLIPLPYTEECMTGFEYAAACSMLQCGMEKEALELVEAVRERYDGKKRNPWAELECGASYSRAMASYSFLLTYSGFRYDLTKGMIGFLPIHNGRYFWSVDGAWGSVEVQGDGVQLEVLYGQLHLKQFITNLPHISGVTCNGTAVEYTTESSSVHTEILLGPGDCLLIVR